MSYGAAVRDRVAAVRFRGELDQESARFEATNPVCGDLVRMAIQVRDGIVVAVRWKAHGCPPTLAAADVLAELATGRRIEAAQAIAVDDIVNLLPEMPATSRHAAQVAQEALRGALQAIASR